MEKKAAGRKFKVKSDTILFAVMFLFLASAPFFMSAFRTNMIGKYMCFALIALGIGMIWGQTGILSLGHGVYFGLGAYCMAMHLKLEASGGALPDFMAWSAVNNLPAFWKPFASPVFTMFSIIAVPMLVAALIGSLTFLNRIRGVYFCILSQALAYALATFLIGRQEYFGGSNGLTGFTTMFGMSINSPMAKLILFYVTLGMLFLAFVCCKLLADRRVGRVFIAVRDAENRARFTGYSPAVYKVFVYCLSAVLAGIAGALYVPQVGIISPSDIGISPSIEMVIWTAVGGKASLAGPILGALVINFLKSMISEQFPAIWQFFMGGIFIMVVMFLPDGLVSIKDVPARIKLRIYMAKEKRTGMQKRKELEEKKKEATA